MNESYPSETTGPLINDQGNAPEDEASQRADEHRSDMLARLRERFLFGV